MTKKEFLDTMDEIKYQLLYRNRNHYSLFTCNIISRVTGNRNDCNYQSKMRTHYEKMFNLNNNPTFNCFENDQFKTRIAALQLFEIISLEQNLYLKY